MSMSMLALQRLAVALAAAAAAAQAAPPVLVLGHTRRTVAGGLNSLRPLAGGIADPETVVRCELCSPPRKDNKTCISDECSTHCVDPGKECHPTGHGGCCCDVGKPPKDSRCQQSIHNQTCLFSCCTPPAVFCGRGCCAPSNHGSAKKCGRKLVGKQTPCCVPAEASLEEQREKNCCIRGRGQRCDLPGLHAACCLWQEAVMTTSDPVVPCQLNCSGYRGCPGPAPAPLGWDCSGPTASRGKKRCCLSKSPSVHDPCQPQQGDCGPGGRYDHCPGQSGIDCASQEHSVCCMPGPSCRSDCRAYDEDSRRRRLRLRLASGAAALLLLLQVAAVFYCWERLKPWLRACCPCLVRRRSSSTNLIIDGRGIHVSPLREPSRRLALVCWCSQYQNPGYKDLPNARRDGEEVAAEFGRLGYDVIAVPEPDRERVFQGVCEAVQKAAGLSEVLIVIYFAGHAVEVEGSLFWAGVDSVKGHMESHVSVTEVLEGLQNVHLPCGRAHFHARAELPKAFFVLLADCCREPTSSSICSCHQAKVKPSRRRKEERPSFFTIFAGEPGGQVSDGRRGQGQNHSPFTQQLLEHMGKPLNLNCLCDTISEGLEGSGERVWLREACGNGSQYTSLAPSMAGTGGSACSSRESQVSVCSGTSGRVMPE